MKEQVNFYKESYYLEMEHKERLNARAIALVGFVQLLFPAFWFLWDKSKEVMPNTICKEICYIDYSRCYFNFIINIVFLISICVTCFFAFKTLFGYKYQYIVKPSLIQKSYNDTYTFVKNNYNHPRAPYRKIKNGETLDEYLEDISQIEFEKNIIKRYIEATDNNFEQNHKKIKAMWTTSTSLAITLGIGLMCLISSLVC